MEVIRNLNSIGAQHRHSVVTIGNFDGVHLGHQEMLKKVIEEARTNHVLAGVVTFEPQPAEFFKAQEAPIRLTTFREKYRALKKAGVDFVLVLSFNQKLATLKAETFIETILVKGLAVQSVWVGDDFGFGQNREGNFTLLERLAKINGFCAHQVDTITKNKQRISSTLLRELLRQGDLKAVFQLLGRYYSLSGRVQKGAQRGKQLGFPTANIKLRQSQVPLSGVFAIQATSPSFEGIKKGVANIGTRPTVDGLSRWLEVYLFDFDDNLYDRRLEIEFIEKLRDEKKFDSLDALKEQIAKDVLKAKEIL
jgi:riboflavin kinase/FMN adenylyltransferase